MQQGISESLQNNLQVSQLKSQTNQLNALNESITDPQKAKNDKKLKEAAVQFESIFINQLLQQMDKTIDRSSGFMSGGKGEQMFREMFYQEIAKDIASNPNNNFGLGRQIYQQLSKYQ